MLYDAATSARITQIFLQEAPEFLEILEQGLLNVRKGWTVQELNHLMRAAHSIKGCAASVGMKSIELISHDLEDVFRALYHRKDPIGQDLEELLLMAFDCLQIPLQQEIQSNSLANTQGSSQSNLQSNSIAGAKSITTPSTTEEIDWVARSQPIFAQLKMHLADEMSQENGSMTSVEELGIDIVEVIFAGDVADGIRHLKAVIKTRPNELMGELRAQAEVFVGVGELTNLPGFREISAAILQAIELHPQQIKAIADIAVQNFRSAYHAVIKGDRIQGGIISDRLLMLSTSASSQFREPVLESETMVNTETITSNSIEALTQTPRQPALPINALGNEPVTPVLSNVLKVDRHRFDRLSAHIGDLVTYESTEQLQHQQLNSIIQSIHHRIEQFEKIQSTLQVMSEQTPLADREGRSLLSSEKFADRQLVPKVDSISTASITQILSDSLQFDTYTPLQNLTQTAAEELACLKEVVQDLVLLSGKKHQQQRRRLQTLHQTQNDLLWIRMLPIEQILQRFPRMVRDLSVQYEKQVSVNLIGSSTLIDKAVLEKLFDPLVHLVRNAFDHGVEIPQKRKARNKPEEATIEIKVYHRGNLTYVEISDDGNGIELNSIKAKAIALGLTTAAKVEYLKEQEILEFIFEPGFSTAIQISELSGRGVGLDAVRENLRSLKGDVQVFSEINKGTMFRLTFPLTLTIADLLIFQTKNLLFSITVDSLSEILVINHNDVELIDNQSFYRDGDELILIADPDLLLNQYPLPTTIDTQLPMIELPKTGDLALLLIEYGDDVIALQVDKIIQRQEHVIKPFNSFVPIPDYLYGCTILGNGQLVPVLDSRAFIQHQQRLMSCTFSGRLQPLLSVPQVSTPTILVVDDTLTTRELLSYSLTQLGFQCLTARDGREALHVLKQAEQVDCVFTDLEMPVMNGFEFIQECRSYYPKSKLPIVVLSSRNGQKHRDLAQKLGANDYLTKPFLEHQIIQVLNICAVVPPAMPAHSNLLLS
jgi:chemotaxis family two-component system sensor histidine kinase/response regulator PixL